MRSAGDDGGGRRRKRDKAGRRSGNEAEDRVEPGDGGIRISGHPVARRSIRRIRAWAGMGALVVVLLLAHRAGVPPLEAGLRALVAGVVTHFAAWAFAIALWRRLVLAELEAVRERMASPAAPPSELPNALGST